VLQILFLGRLGRRVNLQKNWLFNGFRILQSRVEYTGNYWLQF
jgi:hypothetical protein